MLLDKYDNYKATINQTETSTTKKSFINSIKPIPKVCFNYLSKTNENLLAKLPPRSPQIDSINNNNNANINIQSIPELKAEPKKQIFDFSFNEKNPKNLKLVIIDDFRLKFVKE